MSLSLSLSLSVSVCVCWLVDVHLELVIDRCDVDAPKSWFQLLWLTFGVYTA